MQPTPPPPNQPGVPGGAPGQPRPPMPAPAAPTAAPAGAPASQPSKITHARPGIGPAGGAPSAPVAPAAQPRDTSAPLTASDSHAGVPSPAAPSAPAAPAPPKITMFGRERQHEQAWGRTPNSTGTGAIHVKTFHCKLTEDALQYMDQTINEWLDSHPQYEVKFVSSSIGTMTGKLKEPALICQVWV